MIITRKIVPVVTKIRNGMDTNGMRMYGSMILRASTFLRFQPRIPTIPVIPATMNSFDRNFISVKMKNECTIAIMIYVFSCMTT